MENVGKYTSPMDPMGFRYAFLTTKWLNNFLGDHIHLPPPYEFLDPAKKRGLDVFFAGVWDLQTTSFEIPWFLGQV